MRNPLLPHGRSRIRLNLSPKRIAPLLATLFLALPSLPSATARQHTPSARSYVFNEASESFLNANQQQDEKRLAAEQALNEGLRLYNEGTLESLRAAIEKFKEANVLFKEPSDAAKAALALSYIGTAYNALGEKQRALGYYNLSLSPMRSAGDRNGLAITLTNIGIIYSDLGEYERAVDYYKRALPLMREVGDTRGEATLYTSIGSIYEALGQRQEALEVYRLTKQVMFSLGDTRGHILTLTNIGRVYIALGERQNALEAYEYALSRLSTVGDKRFEAITLNGIGTVYAQLGETQKALAFYNLALSLSRTVGDKGVEADVLYNIAGVYVVLGENPKALEFYNLALSLKRAIGDKGGEAQALSTFMLLWDKLGNLRLAVFYGKQSINAYQQLRANIHGLNKDVRLTYLKTIEGNYRKLADLLIAQGRLPEAQQVLGMLKEEEYFEYVRRDAGEIDALKARANLTKDEQAALERYNEIADRVTAVGKRQAELKTAQKALPEGAKMDEAKEAELARLTADLDAANKAFDLFLKELAVEFAKSSKAVMPEIQENRGLQADLKRWGAGTVALYTIVSDERYRVILTTPNTQVDGKTEIKVADLNRKINAFLEILRDPCACRDPLPLAQELYNILIRPVESQLDGAEAQTLLWSLDRSLRYLPIAALHDGKQYMAEKYRNVVITLASRTRLNDEVRQRWRALGLGVSQSVGGFKPLPAVRAELSAIIRDESPLAVTPADSRSVGVLPGRRLLDRAFTAGALTDALGREGEQAYTLVHIASHFSFQPGDADNSFLLLGDGSRLSVNTVRTSPDYDFAGVELLTLSACETAVGQTDADGKEVEGFGALAQERGAKAVLATLWSVADASTSLLMREFYRLRDVNPGVSKAEALQRAQLTLLRGEPLPYAQSSVTGLQSTGARDAKRDSMSGGLANFKTDPSKPYAHPFYWAPFILIGNWK